MTAPVLPFQTTDVFKLRGIDVSTHQAPLVYDPSQLDFVIARASYGDRPDFTAAAHAGRVLDRKRPDGTPAAFGTYVFLRHGTAANSKPAAQIRAAREGLEAAQDRWSSQPGTAPGVVWLDLEDNSQFDGAFSAARAAAIYEEVRADLARDYALGIYTAPGWFRQQFPAPSLAWRELPYWLAHWGPASSARPSPIVWADGVRARIAVWQFGLVQLPSGAKVDGNVAAYWPTPPAPPPPSPPAPPPPAPAPTPSMPALLDQLAAELAAAATELDSAARELVSLPTTHPGRLHVERARSALKRCNARP